MPKQLPAKTTPAADVLKELKTMHTDDAKWREGRTFSLVYWAGDEVSQLVKDAYCEFIAENGLSPVAFPSLRQMEVDVVSMSAGIFHGDDNVAGTMTSGGTESIMMAIKAAREWARHEKGIKELSKGSSARLDRAMEDLQQAVDEYPAYAAAWTTLGMAKAQIGDADGAIAALEKALEADQRYLRPYEPLVRLHMERSEWERASELTKFAVNVNPADTKMRWYQAVATFESGKDDEAIAQLGEIQKDAEGAKQFPQTNHILGMIYAKRGQFIEAAEAYNRYLELDPNARAAEAIKKQLNEWQQLGVL